MSLEYAILLSVILIVFLLAVFIFDQLVGFFLLLCARLISEGLVKYSFGISGINAGSVFGFAIIVYALIIIISKNNSKFNISILRPLYLFLSLSIFSIYNSTNMLLFFSHFFKHIASASLFLISYNLVESIEEGEKALKLFVLISIFPMAYGFYQLITGTGQHAQVHLDMAFHKVMSTFSHPNGYAFYLGLIIFALLILIQVNAKYGKLYFGLLILNTISIIITYSRSVWISVTICATLAFLPNKRFRPYLIVVGLIIYVGFSTIILTRFDDVINPDKVVSGSSSLDFRINMSRALLINAYPKHPFLGFGLGSSRDVAIKYAKMDTVPHNDYMRVLIETGLIGLFGFLAFIFWNLLFLLRNLKYLGKNLYYNGLFIIIIYFTGIIIGTNNFGSVSTGGMWFCLFGILLKLFQLSLREKTIKIIPLDTA